MNRSPRPGQLFVVLVLLTCTLAALALAGCRQVAASLARAHQDAPPDLFGTAIVARTVHDVEARVGGRLRLLDLMAENGMVRIQVQDPQKPSNVDQYELRDGVLRGPNPVQLLGPGNLEASLYSISEVDLGQIPAFTRAALAKLGIEGAQATSLRIQMDEPPGAMSRRLHGEAVRAQIVVRFYADSPRHKGMVDADAHFSILKATVL